MADLATICQGLARAVEAMLNPMSPQTVRMEAYTHCETFKAQSPPNVSMQVGLMLCEPKQTNMVRHFGLKLLEDTIKLHWNEMPPDQKLFMKENAMRLMETGVTDIINEAIHIKDAISRIIVEIIKREWPQHWPNLLSELEAVCQKGDAQTEVAMLVMLRIVEDVAVLQTLEQTQRRKEIYQALVAQMATIFYFLLTLLEQHYKAYLAAAGNDVTKLRHAKVCQSVLSTFNAFVEWVPMVHIMANDHYLVRCLCHLLSDEKLQLHAAECLLSIVGWKFGKLPDRAQLLVLFKTEMMAPLFQAVEAAEQKSHDEHHYIFLKRMVQILVELGGQVCHIWASATGNEYKMPPENFNVYLNALLAFTRHDSQMVNYYANELWAKFLRQGDIAKDDLFRSYIPKWVEVAMKKVIKVGYPSKESHPSCNYARLDFESDEEFSAFFGRYRIIIFEVLKLISATSPVIPYQFTDVWLRSLLANPLNFGVKTGGMKRTTCILNSPIYLELDAIQLILDAVLSKLSTADELQPVLAPATDLLKVLLEFRTPDPLLMSVLLSCVSSLFVVITVTPAALVPTLNKIFEAITFDASPTQPNNGSITPIASPQMSTEAKDLRRHGCCLLVKVGYRYPKTLIPAFDHLRSTIINAYSAGLLHKSEFVTLVEALVLISNEFANYNMQSAFIKTLSEPVCKEFIALLPIVSNTGRLMDYVGLAPKAGSDLETCQKNRSNLSFCLQFLLAISRRATCPIPDIAKCRQGGFIYMGPPAMQNPQNVLALQNPAGPVGCSVLEVVFTFAKTLNDLWAPAARAQLTAANTCKVLDLMDSEKKTLIGLSMAQRSNASEEDTSQEAKPEDAGMVASNGNGGSSKSELNKLQCFVFEQFENIYHFLSQCCISFGHEFYGQPNLSSAISSTILPGLPHIPDFRLRAIVRSLIKSLINKCPQRYFGSVIIPILHQILPFMQRRLTEKWNQVILVRESPQYDEDNADSKEVLDDVICRQLTREYLDVLKAVLTSGGGSDLKFDETKVYTSTENLNKSGTVEGTGAYNLVLSELGKMVLQNEMLCQHVVNTLLEVLVWPDSPTSARASYLLELVLPVIVTHEKLMNDAAAVQIFYTVLRALHTMGQHEPNFIALNQLAVLSYELLRARHASIVEVLAQVPGCSMEDLKRFDDHVLQVIHGKENGNGGGGAAGKPGSKIIGDRTIKNMFKKLTGQLIGKDVAKMFKQDVVIKNLPTLQLAKSRHKTPSLEETETHELGITALFGGQNGGGGAASAATSASSMVSVTMTTAAATSSTTAAAVGATAFTL